MPAARAPRGLPASAAISAVARVRAVGDRRGARQHARARTGRSAPSRARARSSRRRPSKYSSSSRLSVVQRARRCARSAARCARASCSTIAVLALLRERQAHQPALGDGGVQRAERASRSAVGDVREPLGGDPLASSRCCGRAASARGPARRGAGPCAAPARCCLSLAPLMRPPPFSASARPSCSERRAASSEQPIAAAISRCARSARKRSTTAERCRGGSSPTARHSSRRAVARRTRARGASSASTSATGSARRARRAVRVERLAVRDRQHPRPQVRAGAQARVGAQRRDERLLEAVLGLVAPDRRDQKAPHDLAVRRRGRPGRGEGASLTCPI